MESVFPPAPEAGAPPPPRPRLFRPLAVPVFLGLNIAVFLLWQVALRNEALLDFMKLNFAVSALHLMHGHLWTVLTAAFSHVDSMHLLFNMIVLWSFCPPLEKILGRRIFVAFYLAAAVFSSACHCFVSAVLLGDSASFAVGASGALSAMLLVFALLFPKQKILLFMVIPIPALAGVILFIALDIWGLVAQAGGGGFNIGHGAHLGGSLAGLVMYFSWVRPRVAALRSRPPVSRSAPTVQLTADEAVEFERIRAKLNQSGPASLNPKEQDLLRRIRERVMSQQ